MSVVKSAPLFIHAPNLYQPEYLLSACICVTVTQIAQENTECLRSHACSIPGSPPGRRLEVTQVSLRSLLLPDLKHRLSTAQPPAVLIPQLHSLLSHDCLTWAYTPYLWWHNKCASPLEQMSEL